MMKQPKFTWYCCNNNQYFIFDNLCTRCLLRAVDVILPVIIHTTFPFASLVVTAIYVTRTSNSPTSILPFWIISAFIFLRVTMEAGFWNLICILCSCPKISFPMAGMSAGTPCLSVCASQPAR